MGLDMYAFATPSDIPPTFDTEGPTDAIEIQYWRKHPNLHGWMERLYYAKDGKADSFNCVAVRIDPEDLIHLEAAVNNETLPDTQGFFFGESTPEDRYDDFKFIRRARQAHAAGLKVFYTSWW